jgi:hypothetical protein
MALTSLRSVAGAIAFISILISLPAWAQKQGAPSVPQIGSENTVTADPAVPRPNAQPCIVQLFTNLDFANYHPKFFPYTPPSSCPSPWAKVVLNADWSVDAGSQFDRTAEIWIGGTNLYFGTTSEPSDKVARSWHTENDVTEYGPLFTVAQGGRVDLGNGVDRGYPSHLHGTAYLQFYPAASYQQPPAVADMVLPMAADSTGGTATVSGGEQLAMTFSLPTNIERAYLDVYAQSQNNDEWWYECVPNILVLELDACGNTAFRESEVSIDGQPAGIAPVYPWIYTGGLDVYLWRPVPGVQTLNFEPYRIDLTPFAAILSNGSQHTVALSVFNAFNYFSATATLVLYLDHGSRQITGALLKDTLGRPEPNVYEDIQTNGTAYYGPVSVTSNRDFLVSGYVSTSHGKVQTEVAQDISFTNAQTFYVTTDASIENQTVKQLTSIASQTTTSSAMGTRVDSQLITWPFTLNSAFNFNPGKQVTSITQAVSEHHLTTLNGWPIYFSMMEVGENTEDTLLWDSKGNWIPQNPVNSERFIYTDSTSACWDRTVTANNGALTSYKDGCKKN